MDKSKNVGILPMHVSLNEAIQNKSEWGDSRRDKKRKIQVIKINGDRIKTYRIIKKFLQYVIVDFWAESLPKKSKWHH